MKTLVTGANGFIGQNLVSYLELQEGISVLSYTKEDSQNELAERVSEADFIFHVAGVNRPHSEDEFTLGNKELTEKIINILRKNKKQTPILITSSVQAELDNPYGVSKRAAENAIEKWHDETGAPVFIYRLPGVFGKWSRPNYNSVVATFCSNIANNHPIEVSDPAHMLTLAYIDDVITQFARHIKPSGQNQQDIFYKIERTFDVTLGELCNRIYTIHNIRSSLVVPDLTDLLNKFLYATYTSYLPGGQFSYALEKKEDQRGWLAEFLKSQQFGQIFISKTKPGISRGDHWHKTKIEKFLVIEGKAEVTFRSKIDTQDTDSYIVIGDELKVIDIPVGYVHAIKNIGKSELITIFWANELLDKDNPDTFYEKVKPDA